LPPPADAQCPTAHQGFFHLLAHSNGLKKLASRYGCGADEFARRFIAGNDRGGHRGGARRGGARPAAHAHHPAAASLAQADRATREYREICEVIAVMASAATFHSSADAAASTRTQASAVDNLRKVLDRSDAAGFFIRNDTEDRPV
jgi:hypothetical protein